MTQRAVGALLDRRGISCFGCG